MRWPVGVVDELVERGLEQPWSERAVYLESLDKRRSCDRWGDARSSASIEVKVTSATCSV
jgi:hypothetical protein